MAAARGEQGDLASLRFPSSAMACYSSLFSPGTLLPAICLPCGHAHDRDPVANVLHAYRPGSHGDVRTDSHSFEGDSADAKPGSRPDLDIAGKMCARTDVHASAEAAIVI